MGTTMWPTSRLCLLYHQPTGRILNNHLFDLYLGSGHMAYCRASFINVFDHQSTCQISFKSEKLLVDGWTYRRPDIKTGFIR